MRLLLLFFNENVDSCVIFGTVLYGTCFYLYYTSLTQYHNLEFFSPFVCCDRYIPLSRAELPISFGSPGFTFPSLSDCDEIEKSPSSSVMKCKVGSVEAAAKVML